MMLTEIKLWFQLPVIAVSAIHTAQLISLGKILYGSCRYVCEKVFFGVPSLHIIVTATRWKRKTYTHTHLHIHTHERRNQLCTLSKGKKETSHFLSLSLSWITFLSHTRSCMKGDKLPITHEAYANSIVFTRDQKHLQYSCCIRLIRLINLIHWSVGWVISGKGGASPTRTSIHAAADFEIASRLYPPSSASINRPSARLLSMCVSCP